MKRLICTERLPQRPLDNAAACILTDRGVSFSRASWQQCICCDEWIEEENIEYSFTCDLATSVRGAPAVNFELRTRYPAYTCSACRTAPNPAPSSAAAGGSADADDDDDDEAEAEHLCPLHVQAVYMLQGNEQADNMGAVKKVFDVVCPDCGARSRMLQKPRQVQQCIQQHVKDSNTCTTLDKALRSGTYDSPGAFGAENMMSPVQPEKVIQELLSRLVVLTACHIVSDTRPPPTPLHQLVGDERTTAAATAHLRSSSDRSTSHQLMPYRAWAVDALSRDSDLLTEANWVRPSLEGLSLDHKPSLLDLVLAPPYIAVAEHDAGMTVDKLAVLLLLQDQKHSRLHRLGRAAAVGEQVPAAVAAVEGTLAGLLASDAVFQHVPQQQRVQQFLDRVGIASIGDVAYALAQPHVLGRGPQSRHLSICAVCGMTPAALKRAHRSTALHRCKYCIICTCQACRQEQRQQQQEPNSTGEAAAAAEHLCIWCQGHPDTEDLDPAAAGGSRAADSSINRSQQQKQYYTSSPEASADVAEAAAALCGVRHSNGSSLDSQQQQKSPAATAGADSAADWFTHDSDLGVSQAAAAAGPRSSASPAPSNQGEDRALAEHRLQQELEDLQRLQDELQSAAERLGVQGLQLPHLQQQKQQQGTGNNNNKRVLSPDDDHDDEATASKRQRLQQQQKLPSAFTTIARVGYVQRQGGVYAPKHQLNAGVASGPLAAVTNTNKSAAAAAAVKPMRAPRVPRCGDCKTCNNLNLRHGCLVNRERWAAGLPPKLPPGTIAVTGPAATKRAAEEDRSGNGQELTDLLLSSAGFKPVRSSAAARRDQSRSQSAAAAALQAPAALELLVNAGFSDPADTAAPPAAAATPGEAIELVLVKPEQQQQQQQVTTSNRAAAHAAASLVSALESDIQQLTADISSWTPSTPAADPADINKFLQIMRQLKQQMADNYQQTGQQLFQQGMQVLAEIFSAFDALPDARSKVVLASNSQQQVPAVCCPDEQACSVLELLMCCWFKELQDTGSSTAHDTSAAAAELKHDKQQWDIMTAGYCPLMLALLAQLSSLQHLSYGQSAAGQGLPGAVREKFAQALREAAVQVVSGTAVLLLHWPEELSPDDSSSDGSSSVGKWRDLAVQWRQSLLRCKWSVADKERVVSDTGPVENVLRELKTLFGALLRLVGG